MSTRKPLEYYSLSKYGLVDGPFGSDLPASDYTEEGIPVIRGINLSKGEYKFKDEGYKYVSPETANRLERCTCIAGDIVFTKKGTIGQVGIVPNNSFDKYIISSNQMRMRLDPKLANSLYAYYYLSSPRTIKQIEMEAMTTGVPKINLGYIKKFKVDFPPLPTQKKIAAILSAYDDLIENNNQRIQLLEEMAEEIYKEWFVRMRFPGYKDTRFFDKNGQEVPHGMDGALPAGWEEIRIEDAFEILGGGTPSTTEQSYWINGNINWYSPTDITGSKNIFLSSSSKKITNKGLSHSSAKLFPAKCIMMTSRATIGAIGINLTEACTNQGFITCIPNESFSYPLIYHWIKLKTPSLEKFSGGATFKEISRGTFKKFKTAKIPKDILNKFNEIELPIFDEINVLGAKNQVLRETRDLLLPRLISGKLSVEKMEVPV